MSDKYISKLVNKAFQKPASLNVSKNDIGSADAALIVDKEKRGGFWSRFLVSQSGGYDPQYYTQDEAKSTTVLAAAKFASVTLATYSLMKAVYPAFENQAITTLPSIYGVDAKHILTGAAAGALWWGISKLDTAVMHSMRSQKAGKYVAEQFNIDHGSSHKTAWSGLLFRFGISAGSLGISIPALLITASEGTINDYIRRNTNDINAPIVAEYQERLNTVDTYIAELRGQGTSLQTALLDLQTFSSTITEAQRRRLDDLSNLMASLQRQKEQEDARRLEQIRIRDEAIARINQERDGTRGSVPGCRPEARVAPICDAAMADRDDANRSIETIDSTLARINASISETRTEIAGINQQIEIANQARIFELERQRANINEQLSGIQAEIETQTAVRAGVADVNTLAAQDPRYKPFNPDLAEQVDAYIEYMQNEANILDWSRAGFTALMIICMELGVFALASSRQLSPGELRGHLAEAIKSREAGNVYKNILQLQKLKEEVGTDDGIASLKKKRRIMQIDEQNFETALEKLRNDPDLKNQAFEEVLKAYREFGIDAEHAKATDVRGTGSSVSTDEPEETGTDQTIGKKKPSDPKPS